ncbi:MAG TPA: AraC family transcriptional regulator [Kofleriaceae bacterium]|nr:AraC family transcriptional regulator [Kofleriaceae bacterium]
MAVQIQPIELSVPGFLAARISSDVPYVGLKEWFGIVRIVQGHSEFWMRGRTWTGSPGSVMIQQPGDVHRDVVRDGSITYQLLRFPAHVAERVVDNVRLQACLAGDDARAAAFHRLHDAVAANADRFTLECVVSEAVAALTATCESRSERTRPVKRALAMIRERLTETWTLDDLAQHAGLDKFHLCRAFRAQVGMPPHAYLIQLRILHAKELLAAGARPKDIAPRVGLYDQSQLNRHFRRIVGMTPGQFARGV